MVLSDITVGWPPKGSQILDFEKLNAGCLIHTLASYVSVRPHGPSLPAPELSHRLFTIGAILSIYVRGCYVGAMCVQCKFEIAIAECLEVAGMISHSSTHRLGVVGMTISPLEFPLAHPLTHSLTHYRGAT